ncbi:MAG: DUF2895 family protein [bacterium]|nr:DUF2895 family protein [bacterium]
MPVAKTATAAREQDLRFRDRIIALLGVLLALIGLGVWRLPAQLRVYVPPDLTRPQFVKPDEIGPSYIYAFAKLLITRLNYCATDCAEDYLKTVEALRDYLTPSCREDLKMHRERNASLYDNRTRKLLPVGDEIFEPDKVERLDGDVWVVRLQYLLEEHVKGVETRRRRYHYPMRVVRYPIPVQNNAYQLAFDCYAPPGTRPVDTAP